MSSSETIRNKLQRASIVSLHWTAGAFQTIDRLLQHPTPRAYLTRLPIACPYRQFRGVAPPILECIDRHRHRDCRI